MNIKQADMILSIWIIGHDALTKESQMFYANGNGFICKMSDGRDLKAMDKDFLQLIDLGYIEKVSSNSYRLTDKSENSYQKIVRQFTSAAR